MTDDNTKDDRVNIKALPATRKLLNKLADQYQKKQYDLLHEILTEIDKYGFEERNSKTETESELKKLRATFISFIRKQESEILLPMVGKVDASMRLLVETLQGMSGAPGRIGPSPILGAKGPGESRLLDDRIETELQISLEKREKELKNLRAGFKELSKKFVPRAMGGGYLVNISKEEFEEILKL